MDKSLVTKKCESNLVGKRSDIFEKIKAIDYYSNTRCGFFIFAVFGWHFIDVACVFGD